MGSLSSSLIFSLLLLSLLLHPSSSSWVNKNNKQAREPPPETSSPSWNLPFYLDPSDQPYGGNVSVLDPQLLNLFFAEKDVGTYNMSPMLSFLNGMWLASWKNSPSDEDQPGQRVLYSQSKDGETWTGTPSTPQTLFPNISTSDSPIHLFAEPSVLLNGRVYAAASTTQFCLYPDQYQDVLLLREVIDDLFDTFGVVFWASQDPPPQYSVNTEYYNIPSLKDMDEQTQQDVSLLDDHTYQPCDLVKEEGHSNKCEFCTNGCQDWKDVQNDNPTIENERSHYLLPDGGDVILYRDKNDLPNWLYSSVRSDPKADWPAPSQTNITDDVANINAGNLPDGRGFLLSNVLINAVRDPLYLSITDKETNLLFVNSSVLVSCEWKVFRDPPRQPDGCQYRYLGSAKQGGCQYSQAVVVNGSYFYAIFSLNKEDIWIAKVPLSEL